MKNREYVSDAEIVTGLKTIIQKHGDSAFDDKRRAKALIEDVLYQISGGQKHLIDIACDSYVYKLILHASYWESDSIYSRTKDILTDEYSLSADGAHRVIGWMFEACGKTLPEPKKETKTETTYTPVSTPVSTTKTETTTSPTAVDTSYEDTMARLRSSMDNLQRLLEPTQLMFAQVTNAFGMMQMMMVGNNFALPNMMGMMINYYIESIVSYNNVTYLICNTPPMVWQKSVFRVDWGRLNWEQDMNTCNYLCNFCKSKGWIS